MKNFQNITIIIFALLNLRGFSQAKPCATDTRPINDSIVEEILTWAQHDVGRAPLYKVPVVFHVFNGNATDAQIFQIIDDMNRDFRTLSSIAQRGGAVDIEVEFCLAKVNPAGNPTTGIIQYTGSSTIQASGIYNIIGVTNPLPEWNLNNYLNIWIVDDLDYHPSSGLTLPPGAVIGGLSSLPWGANPPLSNGAPYSTSLTPANIKTAYGFDGFVVNQSVIGSNDNRVFTHEIGHYLGLPHPFLNSGCGDGDGLSCTPNAQNLIASGGNAACTGGACAGHAENYMTYANNNCIGGFLGCQKNVMRYVLDNQRQQLRMGNLCDPAYDLAVNTVTATQGTCQDFTTVVNVTNLGSQTLTDFNLQYSLNGSPYTNVPWTGSVAFGGSRNITLPVLNGNVGSNTIIVKVSRNTLNTPNQTDQELTNDSVIQVFNITAPGGSVAITASSTSICDGESVTLTASGGTTYSWSPGGSTASSITVSPTATTTYTLTGPVGGCTTTDSETITVKPLPTTNFTFSNNNICPGDAVTLTASGATTYSWASGGTGATKNVNPNMTTSYTVTGTTNGCSASRTKTLTVVNGPNLNVTSSTSTVCGNDPVTITATGANSYSWSTGETTAAITRTINANTTFTVTGTRNGCTQNTSVIINHNPYPTVNVASSSASVCEREPFTLTASGATSYSWSVGGTGASRTRSENTAGTYNYTVTGTQNGCATTSAPVSVTVNPKPVVNLSVSSPEICQQDNVTLTASGNATNYLWSTLETTNSITASPTITTLYGVVGELNGCYDTVSTTVIVHRFDEAIISGPSYGCEGADIILTASPSPNYQWSTGGSSTNEIFTLNSDVNVRLITKGSPQCPDTAYHAVTMNLKPILSSTITSLCMDENIQHNLNIFCQTPGYIINGIYTNTTVDFIKPSTVLDSILRFSAVDDSGCVSNIVEVVAKQIPDVNVTLSSTEGCEPLEITLGFNSDFVTDIVQNEWDLGDGTVSDLNFPSHTYNAGLYSIFSQHLYSNGCKDSVYLMDTLYVEKRAIARILSDKKAGDKINSIFHFEDGSQFNTTSFWKLDGGYLSDDSAFVYDFDDVGIYNLCLIANTPLGCVDSTCIDIKINDNEHFLIPNTFTPNGDGHNEVFKPVLNVNENQILSYTFRIFDKWGSLVFETKDMHEAWDGTYNGEFIGQKIFLWDLNIDYYKFIGTEVTKFSKRGHVMVLDNEGLK